MKNIKKLLAGFLVMLMILSSVPMAGLTVFAFEADEPVFIADEIAESVIVPEGFHLTGRTELDEDGNTIWEAESEASEYGLINVIWIDVCGETVQNPDYPLAYPLDENGEQVLKGDILPSAYDARDYGLITPVEYQVGGTCWAHAGAAVIETAYLKKFGKTYDLSEYHTAWFGKNSYYSNESAPGNDGVVKADVIGVLNDGGNMTDVDLAMGNFSGGVLESSYPFNTERTNRSSEEELIAEMQNTFTYDTRYQHDIVLEGIKSINYDISALKQAVLDYGAVQVAYFSDDAYYNYRSSSYLGWYVGKYQEDFEVAFYHPTMSDTNHAVTLVGWDDSFSRENFGTYKPERDGAWLIKNSWSTDWGNDGYFWISYEDKSIQRYPSWVVEVGDVDEYDEVYLNDGLGSSKSLSAGSAILSVANVFTAKNDIYLTKISYGNTLTSDYILEVYTGVPENCTNPTDGVKVYSQSGNTNNEKYIAIEGDADIAKDERFAVVLTMNRVYFEGTDQGAYQYTSNPGESFFKADSGVWQDTNIGIDVNGTQYNWNNTCIRAVAKLQEESDTYKVTFKDGTKYSETIIATNGVVTLPEKTGYTYVFTFNNTNFDGTGITKDIFVNTHCYPTDGTISETHPCVTEYECIYCGEKMKDDLERHDYAITVVPATVNSIGYTEKICKICSDKDKYDFNLCDGAVGGQSDDFWWQYVDGNLCIYNANETAVKMPNFTSSAQTPWAEYLNVITTLTVCDNITYLGDYCFSDLVALSELNLSDDITEIGDYCFSNAKALKVFDCPESLTKIYTYAFSNAISLEEINYNSNIKTLGEYAFYGCTSLTEGIIPGTVTYVGPYIFRECSSMKKIIVEEGVTTAYYSLMWCASGNSTLEEIVLPSTITNFSFVNYAHIDKYTISPDNKVYCSVDGVVYSKDMKTLYAYPATKTDKYFSVPDSVETISGYAFSFIKYLRYLDMSSCAVNSIIAKAFNQVQSVYYVNLPETLAEIKADGFYQTYMSKLFIPSTVTAIESGAFNSNGSSYYRIPNFYTDSETATIKQFADANGYNCTVLHTEHNYNTVMSDMKKNPTCKDEGTSLKTCACGSFEYTVIPVTGEHSLVKGETVAPTCIEAGYTVYSCSVCGITENKDEVTALGHSFEWIIDKEATCNNTGVKHEKCMVCGETQSEKTIIPATGEHVYTPEVTKPATHLEEGIKTFTCSVCGDKYTEAIAKLESHTYTEKVTDPTCEDKGYTTYTCACGHSYDADYKDALGHTGGVADCKDRAVCTRCGTPYGEIDAANHKTIVADKAVAATCTSTGLTEGSHCEACKVVIVAQTVTDKLAHEYTPEITKPATHLEEGIKTFTCSVCGDKYTEAIAKLEGHTYTEKVTDPTCEDKGYTTYTCACGHSYDADYKDALGHSFGDWYETKAATCTVAGEEERVCVACNEKETRETTKLAHEYVTSVTAPTCEDKGYTTYTCACGHSYKDNYTDKAPHDFDGETCKKCGYNKVENCGCNCHKSGFSGFIWKILRFFYKLFKTNPVCECGAKHY